MKRLVAISLAGLLIAVVSCLHAGGRTAAPAPEPPPPSAEQVETAGTEEWLEGLTKEQVLRVADAVLADWIRDNPADARLLAGARPCEIADDGKLIRVTLWKDASVTVNGTLELDQRFFHVYMDSGLNVVRTERGPDASS